MAASPSPQHDAVLNQLRTNDKGSKAVVLGSDSNELIFAVVGHAGSGTTLVADTLAAVLEETSFNDKKIEVRMLKARDVITAWAIAHGFGGSHSKA